MNPKPGSCLCGAVTFEIDGDFKKFYLCHCSLCRKDTGSAHAANLFSSTATLRWFTGEDKVTNYNLPSTRHNKAFCSVCGSALPIVLNDGKFLVVPAGSLDCDVDITPTSHIFVSSKANWDENLHKIEGVEAYPSKD